MRHIKICVVAGDDMLCYEREAVPVSPKGAVTWQTIAHSYTLNGEPLTKEAAEATLAEWRESSREIRLL